MDDDPFERLMLSAAIACGVIAVTCATVLSGVWEFPLPRAILMDATMAWFLSSIFALNVHIWLAGERETAVNRAILASAIGVTFFAVILGLVHIRELRNCRFERLCNVTIETATEQQLKTISERSPWWY